MPKERENQYQSKARLLVLLKMFYELTDEDHPMTNTEIIEYMKFNGVQANVKTLRDDVALLNQYGFDIVTIVSRPNKYFWGSREFEIPELKLLVDAVSSSRFITEKKSKALCRKLYRFSSKHQRRAIKRNLSVTGRPKSVNEEVYYTIDTVNDAINSHRKISFQYTEYDRNAKRVLRNNGEVYELSPYALFWNDDNYYVVGWSEKHGNVSVFRADRLFRAEVLKERAVKRPADFKLSDYSRRIFEMYDGEQVTVRLKCRNEFMKYVVDRFGEKLALSPCSDEGWFIVSVEVSLSPTFYSWVFTFAGDIEILSPEKAVNDMKERCRKVLDI